MQDGGREGVPKVDQFQQLLERCDCDLGQLYRSLIGGPTPCIFGEQSSEVRGFSLEVAFVYTEQAVVNLVTRASEYSMNEVEGGATYVKSNQIVWKVERAMPRGL